MWEEEKLKEGHYRSFRKKDSMCIIHFIHFANKNGYMVVNENAFDVPTPKLLIMSPNDIYALYGIKL